MAKKFDSMLDDVQRESIQAYFKKPEEKKTAEEAAVSDASSPRTVSKRVEKQPVKASPSPSGNEADKSPIKKDKQENTVSEASEDVRENRSKRISVLTTPEIFKNVNALAFLYGMSVNEIINSQVEKYIADNEKDLSFALEVMNRKESYKGGKK